MKTIPDEYHEISRLYSKVQKELYEAEVRQFMQETGFKITHRTPAELDTEFRIWKENMKPNDEIKEMRLRFFLINNCRCAYYKDMSKELD